MRSHTRWQYRFLLCPLALILIAGCGKKQQMRYDLSGTVTHNGKPVPVGYMVFEPDAAAGNSGPGAQADIRDGKFVTGAGQGTVGGPHVVHIFGFDGNPNQTGEGDHIVSPLGKPLFDSKELRADFPKKAAVRDFVVPQ